MQSFIEVNHYSRKINKISQQEEHLNVVHIFLSQVKMCGEIKYVYFLYAYGDLLNNDRNYEIGKFPHNIYI